MSVCLCITGLILMLIAHTITQRRCTSTDWHFVTWHIVWTPILNSFAVVLSAPTIPPHPRRHVSDVVRSPNYTFHMWSNQFATDDKSAFEEHFREYILTEPFSQTLRLERAIKERNYLSSKWATSVRVCDVISEMQFMSYRSDGSPITHSV